MVSKILLGYEEALWPKIGDKSCQSNFETRSSDFGSCLNSHQITTVFETKFFKKIYPDKTKLLEEIQVHKNRTNL